MGERQMLLVQTTRIELNFSWAMFEFTVKFLLGYALWKLLVLAEKLHGFNEPAAR